MNDPREHFAFLNRSWAMFYHVYDQHPTPLPFAEWGEGGPFYSSFIWHLLDPPYSPLATEDDQ